MYRHVSRRISESIEYVHSIFQGFSLWTLQKVPVGLKQKTYKIRLAAKS